MENENSQTALFRIRDHETMRVYLSDFVLQYACKCFHVLERVVQKTLIFWEMLECLMCYLLSTVPHKINH